ncbi:MAG: benzoate-CoA ligase family protein [Nonomuraea sp.]|nr:benzoate-CoA ligase family protein [Nonomuraea sp.]NUP68662.1 benzoate-CoA ligase family protein [Nonomuraea sp.]NUS06630.1 benzoate-CoA ligase family protein [Nonomuraea sp.]
MPAESFNASVFLVDRLVEAGHGDRVAVAGPAGTMTYAQLAAHVAELAGGLRVMGVRPEERVLLVMPDCPEALITMLAVMRMGAVAVPVSTMYNGSELGALVRDSRARVVVSTPEFEPAVQEALLSAPEVVVLVLTEGLQRRPGVSRTVTAMGTGPAVETGVPVCLWSDVMEAGKAGSGPYETWPDSPALWLYTSGTTGAPKAAMHRHGALHDVHETYGRQVLGIRPEDRCFSVARLFFAYGLGNSMIFPLAEGATTILDPARPTPGGVVERVLEERPTLFFAGPAFYAALLTCDAPEDAFASVRLAVSAGEALPAELHRRFTARFGVDVIDGLGSTEALHIFISNRPGQARPGSSGTIVPGYEARILDDSGAPVPDGEPGHLYVRGDSVATGYWCRTATTRQVFQGEWLRTGDTYARGEDGYYTCLGRSNDMIKAGGIWVSPMEVEARLAEHDSVAECAVVAHIDADGLERPVACVVPAPGREADPAELIEFCRDGLAAFKRPREILVLDELPKTVTGKVQRVVVRQIAADLLGK